jgi:superfamily II DNA or RNA helicase
VSTLPIAAFDTLIIDEAHHFPSSFWKVIVDLARKHAAKVIFLTATPYRADKKNVFEPLPGVKKRFYHLSIKGAQEQGYIRSFKLVPVTVPLDPSAAKPVGPPP